MPDARRTEPSGLLQDALDRLRTDPRSPISAHPMPPSCPRLPRASRGWSALCGTPAETRHIISWIFAAHQMGGALAGIGAGAVRSFRGDYLVAFMPSRLACLLASLLALRIRGLAPAIVPAV